MTTPFAPAGGTPFDRLVYWITERESIRLKKESGQPPPWTNDPILRRYRFCNVRRMDDKVSRWLLENWYGPNAGHPNTVPAAALARFVNKPESLEAVRRFVFQDGFPPAWGSIKRTLRALRNAGPVFNAAYMVRGAEPGGEKIAEVVDRYVRPLSDDPPEIDTDSMRRTWKALLGRYGFGSFMAGQVTADLRWAIEGAWADKDCWAPLGPGSRRGMNRVLGRDSGAGMRQGKFVRLLRDLIVRLVEAVPAAITDRLEAMDYQNCLCEFAKVEKVREGGRAKQTYDGEGVVTCQ